jgi:glyoxylase-like metal-dependent hydrolase (beta-lactamase superfamily II)
MKSWKTTHGYEIFQVLSGRSNAYLILKESNIILVDTGKKSALGKLSKNLALLNFAVENVSTLILTHTHFDHCQSAWEIQKKSSCQVIVSASAADSIKNGYTMLPNGAFPPTKLIARLGRLIGKRKFGYESFQPHILVDDEYNLNVAGDKIKITGTPGHSADCLSILVDSEIAIVGDAMFGVFPKSIFPPYSDDIAKMVESWGKLLNTGCNLFLPGHGKEIKRNLLQKEFEKYSQKYP